MSPAITVQILVNQPITKVWEFWNEPQHIVNWAFASDDWEVPAAHNDLRVGKNFIITMAAKDKSARFDFTGAYTNIINHKLIEYTIEDGRTVSITFETTSDGVLVTETFDPENENSEEMQRAGWQALLNNFKKYVEGN